MNASGYAAYSPTEPLRPFSFERRAPRPDDVAIEILYCGVCHTDLHFARGHKGGTFPLVPGHEIVGRVTGVGSEVTRVQVGQVVGVGCMVDSCGHCAACDGGHEQHCLQGMTPTYNGTDRHDGSTTYGGYSDRIVVPEHFVLNVPDQLDLAGVAPLLCAGITTWSPLRRWKVGPGSRVAVVGLGGLGHMALKLAKAMGAEVTLFSRSPGKEADARRLGADHVVISTDAEQMAAIKGKYDLIVDTVPYDHDLNPYVPTLSFHGTLVLVGYMGPLDDKLNTLPVVFGGRAVAGSFIGGIPETQAMLDFCGEHGIVSDVELIRMQEIEDAYERMLRSDVKYRFVIDMASLKA
ncbi:NAD(P)-dependent alcohol dehydrogenase [Xylella fastidiosa]|uniref:NADP-alcohol dehydrogenase n=1 Tax=Xylella fastidiosa (strain 9a5c) TaxID=160492 RepID=Q9PCP4_XYLFA|nr:NAD(P)-dependent alcohol dehydrogenase [Xylella fastidiosa]AAF84543.1 NADP-alcohol dehydrogenase [Xylella fastidiosa 9a5c]ALQ95013.1 hydroxyacid dehydrogenase [Xylella fastidiosa]ALQ97072.1 NAD(P)-dependent alcohol dehydrogenase [Xylella fastidiosa]ALR02216.1 hydroxyacid dehydrogenase [Xylella fastidiosa]ALR04213.1 NAD(P)-dependent alcohol dehydrogenase [Xylella fastidiosa]